MKRVIIEYPYAGDVQRNIQYAKLCLKDSLMRGEAPIASHLLYTQVLDDLIPEEWKMGIDSGLAWIDMIDLHVFYLDYGWSSGMIAANKMAEEMGINVENRMIL